MSYLRPANNEWQADIEIKKSQFIGLAKRTAGEDEARQFIQEIKERYPDARHHCSAYLVYQDGAQPIERSSDDGEPAGTAGQPMLEVLRGTGALDLTVVVVRYFGGVLLGTGGLVRAYQDSTKEALKLVDWVRREKLDLYTVTLNFVDAGRIESELRNAGYQVLDTQYGEAVTLTITGDEDLLALVASLTSGQVEPKRAGQRWVDVPVE